MAVQVYSFDFDGCLFHRDYCYSEDKDVIKHNTAFFDRIKLQIEAIAATKVITFVGSNRQSFSVDINNSIVGGKGSCFPAIKKVSAHLGATLDPFLLADIYGKLEAGTSFALATEEPCKWDGHADWLFDKTKMTVLYAQMHRVATQNPEEEIIYDFFDDKKDILFALCDFYNKYKELIPHNVTLRIHQYAGDQVETKTELRGIGMIDKNHCETVRQIGRLSVTYFGVSEGMETKTEIRMHESVIPDKLTCREALVIQKTAILKDDEEGIVLEGELETLASVFESEVVVTNSLDGVNALTDTVGFANASPSFFKRDALLQQSADLDPSLVSGYSSS